MTRFLLLSLTVVLAFRPTAPSNAQPADHPGAAAPDSLAAPALDSLEAALGQFEATGLPTPADSVRLRRWADSVQAEGQSLERKNPGQARGYFQHALRASKTLADSVGIARYINEMGRTYELESQFDREKRA